MADDREVANQIAQDAARCPEVKQCVPIFIGPTNYFLHLEMDESMVEVVQTSEKRWQEAERLGGLHR